MTDGARHLVPCRCDACGEAVDFGVPGDVHWRRKTNATWADGRGGVRRGTILRRCNGHLVAQTKDTKSWTAQSRSASSSRAAS